MDISALNVVYMRNMPPTPANYAQRSGRAGRSGQAALVVTYCSAQGPHDQYYFRAPREMVSGIVRPPALDLANRDLVEAHLHAVWLAESGKPLEGEIPHVLDLADPRLPVQRDISDAFAGPELKARSAQSMRRILDSIDAELTSTAAPWAIDRQAFADGISERAPSRFSESFDRWRQLYDSARAQLVEANRRSEMHGLPATERNEAKIQQRQANDQIALLERGSTTGGTDFSTYRYLATEGFLPGYNFPRLPLYAYVPAVTGGGPKAAYLQRARFLAIAEFGPRSLIYHEGRGYRVYKAKLPPGIARKKADVLQRTFSMCAKNAARRISKANPNAAMRVGLRWVAFIRSGTCCASTMWRPHLPSASRRMTKIGSARVSRSRRCSHGRDATVRSTSRGPRQVTTPG